ncbi:MAG: plasmid pRiA4b ORF-3 family protein [Bacteroidales bacterium]|nr:plasmid pRiA4b ORF-3 family protein [Bacteroidales bacterium]MCF8336685.1 plasmid pRiA4b ORF-3 family protein [Bacteroidales bacterium]
MVDFHKIIQTTMGWTNSHLHVFSDGLEEYSPKEFEVEFAEDSRTVRLNQILKKEKSEIIYEYDFGDGWEHSILLDKILPPDDQLQIPECIAGKRNCPPENCGGPWGYMEMLEIFQQPDHEEYESYMEWLEDDFDPEYFDKDKINKRLKKKDYGCIWL